MAFSTLTVSGTINLPGGGGPAASAQVAFQLNEAISDGVTTVGTTLRWARADALGVFSFPGIVCLDDLTTTPQGAYYTVTVAYEARLLAQWNVLVPAALGPSVDIYSLPLAPIQPPATVAPVTTPTISPPAPSPAYVEALIAGSGVVLDRTQGIVTITVVDVDPAAATDDDTPFSTAITALGLASAGINAEAVVLMAASAAASAAISALGSDVDTDFQPQINILGRASASVNAEVVVLMAASGNATSARDAIQDTEITVLGLASAANQAVDNAQAGSITALAAASGAANTHLSLLDAEATALALSSAAASAAITAANLVPDVDVNYQPQITILGAASGALNAEVVVLMAASGAVTSVRDAVQDAEITALGLASAANQTVDTNQSAQLTALGLASAVANSHLTLLDAEVTALGLASATANSSIVTLNAEEVVLAAASGLAKGRDDAQDLQLTALALASAANQSVDTAQAGSITALGLASATANSSIVTLNAEEVALAAASGLAKTRDDGQDLQLTALALASTGVNAEAVVLMTASATANTHLTLLDTEIAALAAASAANQSTDNAQAGSITALSLASAAANSSIVTLNAEEVVLATASATAKGRDDAQDLQLTALATASGLAKARDDGQDPQLAALARASAWIASAGTASAIVGPALVFATSGPASAQVSQVGGSALVTFSVPATAATSFTASGATPAAGSQAITSKIDFLGSAGASAAVGTAGDGAPLVTITAPAAALSRENVNLQSGLYPVVPGDNGSVLTFAQTSGGVLLPSPVPPMPFKVTVINDGQASGMLLNPNGAQLNAVLGGYGEIPPGAVAFIWSDGVNYHWAPPSQPSLRDYYQTMRPNKHSVAVYETIPAWSAGDVATGTGGAVTLTAISLPAGVPIGHITYAIAGPGATPQHTWFCLCDGNWDPTGQNGPTILAITADQLAQAYGTALMTLGFAATAQVNQKIYTTPYAGLYYVGSMFKTSGAQPTLAGCSNIQLQLSTLLTPPPQVRSSSTAFTTAPAVGTSIPLLTTSQSATVSQYAALSL